MIKKKQSLNWTGCKVRQQTYGQAKACILTSYFMILQLHKVFVLTCCSWNCMFYSTRSRVGCSAASFDTVSIRVYLSSLQSWGALSRTSRVWLLQTALLTSLVTHFPVSQVITKSKGSLRMFFFFFSCSCFHWDLIECALCETGKPNNFAGPKWQLLLSVNYCDICIKETELLLIILHFFNFACMSLLSVKMKYDHIATYE